MIDCANETLDELLSETGYWTDYSIATAGGPVSATMRRMRSGHVPRSDSVRRLAGAIGVSYQRVWRAIMVTVRARGVAWQIRANNPTNAAPWGPPRRVTR